MALENGFHELMIVNGFIGRARDALDRKSWLIPSAREVHPWLISMGESSELSPRRAALLVTTGSHNPVTMPPIATMKIFPTLTYLDRHYLERCVAWGPT